MPYPDNFNDAAFERTWGEDEPEDTRNEDDVRESREGVSGIEKAIFDCFRPGATLDDQIKALNELTAGQIGDKK